MTTASPTVVASQREAARLLGVSHTALQKAVRAGRVSAEPGGGWCPSKLSAQLAATADPARAQHAMTPHATSPTDASARPLAHSQSASEAGLAAQPPQSVTAAAGAVSRQTGGGGTFQDARTVNEVLKAQERRLRLDERRGKLVDKGRALLLVHRFAREERDALLGWPARIAALVAAQLGVDPHQLQSLLDHQLRAHLVERSRLTPGVG